MPWEQEPKIGQELLNGIRRVEVEAEEAAMDSCTLLTTTPNDLMRPLHPRIPVILRVGAYDQWLDWDGQDIEPLQAILRPYPGDNLITYPVSTRVNNPANNSPNCLAPVA